MKLSKIFVMAAGMLGVLSAPVLAQNSTNMVTVTNFVTVTVLVTNVVTITNEMPKAETASATLPGYEKATAVTEKEKPTAMTPVKYPWNSTITAGLSLTRGNSRTLLATLKATTGQKTPINELNFEGDANYGSANSVENSQQFHGFGQWNHLFTDRAYSLLRVEGLHDGIAQVKYRATLAAGVGYYLLKETNKTLAVEFGPGEVLERVGENSTFYATARLGERYEYKFGAGARIWQTAEVLPQVDRWSDYLINFELGAEAPISKKLSLTACLDDNYNSEPAQGLLRNDVKLVSGITYKF